MDRGMMRRMADLEKMALKRDRGYLARLLLLLGVAVLAAVFLFAGLTGETFSTCMADAFVGAPRPTERTTE